MFSKIKSGLNYTFNYSQHLKEKFSEAFKSEDLKQIKLVMKEVEDHITKKKKNISEIISPKALEGTLFLTLNKKKDGEEKAFIEQVLKLMASLSDSDKENLRFNNLLKACSTQELVSALTESDYSLPLRLSVIPGDDYQSGSRNSILKKNDLELIRELNPKFDIRKSVFLDPEENELITSGYMFNDYSRISEELIDLMIHVGFDFITPSYDTSTPLTRLARDAHLHSSTIFDKVAKEVYKQGGSDSINHVDRYGMTALIHILISNRIGGSNCLPQFISLIECDADVRLETKENRIVGNQKYKTSSFAKLRSDCADLFTEQNYQVISIFNNRLKLDDISRHIASNSSLIKKDINNHKTLQQSVESSCHQVFNKFCDKGVIQPELVPFAKKMLSKQLEKNLVQMYYSNAFVYRRILPMNRLPADVLKELFEKMVVATFNAQYNAENPEAAKRGYGPGALVVAKATK